LRERCTEESYGDFRDEEQVAPAQPAATPPVFYIDDDDDDPGHVTVGDVLEVLPALGDIDIEHSQQVDDAIRAEDAAAELDATHIEDLAMASRAKFAGMFRQAK
jgi:hypothetical protein